MVMVGPVDQAAVIKFSKTAADCLFFQAEEVRNILPRHGQIDRVEFRIIFRQLFGQRAAMPQIQEKYRQSLMCGALPQAINQIQRVLEYAKHHVKKCPLSNRVLLEALLKQLTRPARHLRIRYGLHAEEIRIGRAQTDKVVLEQEAQHLTPAIITDPTDHQRAIKNIEYLVGIRARMDQRLARLKLTHGRALENIEKHITGSRIK